AAEAHGAHGAADDAWPGGDGDAGGVDVQLQRVVDVDAAVEVPRPDRIHVPRHRRQGLFGSEAEKAVAAGVDVGLVVGDRAADEPLARDGIGDGVGRVDEGVVAEGGPAVDAGGDVAGDLRPRRIVAAVVPG